MGSCALGIMRIMCGVQKACCPDDEAVEGCYSPTGVPTTGCCSLHKSGWPGSIMTPLLSIASQLASHCMANHGNAVGRSNMARPRYAHQGIQAKIDFSASLAI